MTCFVELVWRNYKKRRRVVVHGLLPVYFQHLLDHFKVLSHGVLSHFSALSDGRVIRFVGMELHILLDLPCFIQRVADDALHKLLEDLFAVVQPDLVASYTLHLLVQCFFYSLCSVSCRIAWWLVYRWKQYVGGFLPAYITSY